MKRLDIFIFGWIVLLVIYQDSPLGLIAGAFGYSLVPTISILLWFAIVIKNEGKIKIVHQVSELGKLAIYLIVISIASLFVWFIQGGNLFLLGENIIVKSIKVLLYFFSYIAFLYDMNYITRYFTEKDFLEPIFNVFIFITLICIVEYFTKPYAFSFLHFTGGKYYGRIRLLSKESSWTSMTIFVYGILSLYYSVKVKRNYYYLIITCVCLTILLGMSSSKTLLIVVFLSVIAALLINAKKMTSKALTTSLGLIFLGVIAYLMLANRLTSAIEISLQWSSIFTRVYTALIGFIIGIIYPMGIGTAVYLYYFPFYLQRYYYILAKYDGGYALAEINSFIRATTDEAVTVKSGLLQYNMYWGIIGTIWFLRFYLREIYIPYTKLNIRYSTLIRVAMIVTLIMLLLSNDFTFEFWLLTAFVMHALSHQGTNDDVVSGGK